MVAASLMAMVVSVVIVIGGTVISSLTGDWSWLSRSGSLVVAYGIVFAAQSIDKYVSTIPEDNALIRLDRKDFMGSATPKDKERFTKFIRHVQRSTEVRLLVCGTLIWGFGDLPNSLMLLFNE